MTSILKHGLPLVDKRADSQPEAMLSLLIWIGFTKDLSSQ